ncbi:MAG: nucleotidyltransferase [Alkaliphilus sp.]
MRVLGLITEYNPFHNGHLYHLQESLRVTRSTHCVAAMSGNFLQRGAPAMLHKWARAEMAVASGVDLVLELPTVYACSSAEIFSYGSVSLLHKMGIVDAICFGSEEGNLEYMSKIAHVLVKSPDFFNARIRNYLKRGLPFVVSRSNALLDYFKTHNSFTDSEINHIEQLLQNPNNILSIEYLKAVIKLDSHITPYTILRKKSDYHSKTIASDVCSATAIREHLENAKKLHELKNVMPAKSFSILKENINNKIGPIFSHNLEDIIFSLFRRESADFLKQFFDVNEGLNNKIYRCASNTNNIYDFYNCIKSKRYTLTRIQRIAMHVLLNIKKKDIVIFKDAGPQYLRVLAFNSKGCEILKACKKNSDLPIVNKLANYVPQNDIARSMLDIDLRATDMYRLFIPNQSVSKLNLEFTNSPIYLR